MNANSNVSLKDLKKEQTNLFEKSMYSYYVTIILNIVVILLLVVGIYNPLYIFGLNASMGLIGILFFTLKDMINKRFDYKFNKAMLLMLN